MPLATVLELRCGQVGIIGPPGREEPSAIAKARAGRPLALGLEGFEGDTVADRRHHGGPDKAVCVYPASRYERWTERYGSDLRRPAFGENLLLDGVDEASACVGDVWRVGGALVQVSQPRVPCHKPAAYTGESRLTLDLRATGWTGWYLRVLECGTVAEGDAVELVDRVRGAWSVIRLNTVRYAAVPNDADLAAAATAPALTERWRAALHERLSQRRS